MTLLSLPSSSVGFLRSRTPSPVTRRDPAHNFFLFSPFDSLLTLVAHSFLFSVFASCVAPSPAAVLRFLWERRPSVGLTHTAPFNRLIPYSFKGPNAGSNFSRSQAPLCAGAAQDIALRLACVLPLGCKHSLVRVFFELREKVCCFYSFIRLIH